MENLNNLVSNEETLRQRLKKRYEKLYQTRKKRQNDIKEEFIDTMVKNYYNNLEKDEDDSKIT